MLGVRFYGIGNELKSGLAVLVFAAVAAALYPAIRGRRAALSMAGAGVLLAVVEGSARIGAGVGGVILVSAGTAVATVMLLPGALTRRRALIVLIAPILGLVALAALDLATAHGTGHYTGSILHARSPGDLRDVIVRRYSAAFGELHNHAMPVATLLALICAVLGRAPAHAPAGSRRRRSRLAGRALRRPRRRCRRRARRGLRPRPARRRGVHPDLRARLPVGKTRLTELSSAASRKGFSTRTESIS